MSRSRHTDPRAVRAARRGSRPRDARAVGDLAERRRLGRLLRDLGAITLADRVAADATGQRLLGPRVTVVAPRPGFEHPASRTDVLRLLGRLGPDAVYGLHAIELARAPASPTGLPHLGRLIVPGLIQLFELPRPPWRLPGPLTPQSVTWLAASGAVPTPHAELGDLIVDWPGDTLRGFVLNEILLHEIGHHVLQHHTGKRPARVVRTRDHESFARLWAERCRAALALSPRSP